MITKLTEIKNLGIFENFKHTDNVEPFLKYNLIYGWNGSGKTTLGKLFRIIENYKTKDSAYKNLTFKIEANSGNFDEKFLVEPPTVKVFNKDFITQNTNLEKGKTNALLFIGADKDNLNKQIKKLEEDLFGLDGKGGKKNDYKNEIENNKKLTKSKEDFFINSAAQIRELSYSTIFPNPGADKRMAEKIWDIIKTKSSLNDSILSENDYKNSISFIAQGVKKDIIDVELFKINQSQCENHYYELSKMLSENPLNKSIQRLKENPEIAVWVQTGLALHKEHNSLKCEYCNNTIEPSRIAELTEHFNETFIEFQKRIEDKIKILEAFKIKEISIDEKKWFPELERSGNECIQFINEKQKEINQTIDSWIKLLDEKKSNPLKNTFTIHSIGNAETISIYNRYSEDLQQLISRQNTLINEFEKKAYEYKLAIEYHIVASKAKAENFNQVLVSIELSANKIKNLNIEIESVNSQIVDKRKLLLNDELAIEEINTDLTKFLTSSNFRLEKNTTNEGGYLIKRNNEIAENLSEGEKTAIALCFFMAKLKEQGNNIQKNIIVFDDPISSLDSNHLFSACTYITNKCENAQQVFFLTHNFWFFKLIRDWVKRKNEKKNKDGKPIVGNFYTIKQGKITNSDKTLTDYHSEYHFIFNSLYQLKTANLTLADSYSIANYSRRLLESFNSFKTQETSGFNGILQKANGIGIDKQQTDKLFYYLNKYSHLDRIENFENTIENIEAEGLDIINTTLLIIEKVDDEHFKSMIKACG